MIPKQVFVRMPAREISSDHNCIWVLCVELEQQENFTRVLFPGGDDAWICASEVRRADTSIEILRRDIADDYAKSFGETTILHPVRD